MSDTQVKIVKSPAGHYVMRRKYSGNTESEPFAAAYDRKQLTKIAKDQGWDLVRAWRS